MRKQLSLLLVFILCWSALGISGPIAVKAQSMITVNIPTFPITLNDVVIDNATRYYPLITYKDITYFPLTYTDSRFMNLTADWSDTEGLSVKVSHDYLNIPDETLGTIAYGSYPAVIVDIPIYINEKAINNADEEFPLVMFRDVTYFPLTWRFAGEEFGWDYSFDDQRGLVIDTRTTGFNSLGAEWYDLNTSTPGYNIFTNLADAYSIELPANMWVDMNLPYIRAVLANDSQRIEIYRQEMNHLVSPQSYSTYSNRFKQNWQDHHIQYDATLTINGCRAVVLQWYRDKLALVENDKNYYASVDLVYSNHEVFTFLFKSEQPFADSEEYLSVVRSFRRQGDPLAIPISQDLTPSQSVLSTETNQVFEQYFGARAKLSWGIFSPQIPGNFIQHKIMENRFGYKFPFVLHYTHFNSHLPNVESALSTIKAEGRYTELTLQTSPTEDGHLMMYDVLKGDYEPFLREYAQIIAKLQHPILMRLGNEMNGDWCSYSAWQTSKDTELFKAFYLYVYRIFEEEGANPYTIWVWNPNEKSFPDFKWNHSDLFYPGGQYVDIIGLTGYNTGTYYPGEKWRSFAEIYDPIYHYAIARYNKPLMITEFSCSSIGGNKPQWVHDMFAAIRNYDRIKVAVWWHGADYSADGHATRPYWINDTEEVIMIFRNQLNTFDR